MKQGKSTGKKHWRRVHKWVGLVFCIFLLLFCVSGIILNHREAVAGIDVNRSLLPDSYRIRNYNNGIVKGTVKLDESTVLSYGCAGLWLTDTRFGKAEDFNAGLPSGVDGRNVRNVVRTKDGTLWCAAQFGLYKLNGGRWEQISLPANKERLSDVALTADSTSVVVLTRSAAYVRTGNADSFKRVELSAPEGYEAKVSLFKTVWLLHSGELFGVAGKTVVDLVALTMIFLSLSGIVILILPAELRRHHRGLEAGEKRVLRWNFVWHNRVGRYTIVLTMVLAFTGMCLRPPLMIPFALTSTRPVPGSTLSSENAWHDKLRGIRWSSADSSWLISTSDGFALVDKNLTGQPRKMAKGQTPPVSPMGVTVFEEKKPGEWLIGSFSGLYRWETATGKITDAVSGKAYEPRNGSGRPAVSANLVSGYSEDFEGDEGTLFDYSRGAILPSGMPGILGEQKMSLWNAALELHVGRCYTPFLGPLSDLFVFLSGALVILILISGYIIRIKTRHHQ